MLAPDAVKEVEPPAQIVDVPEIAVVTTIGVPETANDSESPVVVTEIFPEKLEATADILI